MPNLDNNDLPHWADPTDYEPDVDERIFDQPGDGHIHSIDRCEHYRSGEEIGWLCGMFPMFTNAATAKAQGDEHEVSLGEAMVRALFAIDDAECLHLATGRRPSPRDACGWLYRYREGDDGFSRMVTAMVER